MLIQGIPGYNQQQSVMLGESNTTLSPGNYLCKILDVQVQMSKNLMPMLVIRFDIAEGEFENYYTKIYKKGKENNYNNKYRGIYYQGMTGNSTKFYKGLLNVLEKLNNIKLDGENGFDSNILKGKQFIGRFGEEEYLNNNFEIKTTTRLRFITDNLDAPLLDKKEIKKPKDETETFYIIEESIDDDTLPF